MIERFLGSMVLDFDAWHDGTGYDIEALRQASRDEQASVIARLDPPGGWRDVEALAVLAAAGHSAAASALREALVSTTSEVRLAVVRFAPGLVDQSERTTTLVRALEGAAPFDGLSSTLAQVEEFHPPEVIAALWRGLLAREGEVACHYAAMLAFLHGKADSSFDWSMRPLFLKFNTSSDAERRSAFRELCETIGMDAELQLGRLTENPSLPT